MPDTSSRRLALLETVRDVLTEHLHMGIERDQIQPNTPLFGTGLGLDSIDAVDLAVGLERRTGSQLPDTWEGRAAMRTVNTVISAIIAMEDDRASDS